MSLKCPLCGDKYSYDRKICQRCEDHSKLSDLTSIEMNKIQRWNCAIFLNSINNPFGKSYESYVKIASEPKVFNFNKCKDYDWNCDDVRTINMVSTSNIASNMKDNTLLISNSLKLQKRNIDTSLIYE